MRKLFDINEDEKNRILEMHVSATKRHYLNEQDVQTSSTPLTIPIGGTFASGVAEISDTSRIDAIIPQIEEYIRQFPKNTKITLSVDAGESQVPNQEPYKTPGSLAFARAKSLRSVLENKLAKYKNILDFGTKPNVTIGKTPWDPTKGAKDPNYTKEQFVNVVITPSGEKSIKPAPFCKGGKFLRQQSYYPGYSPMLGKNWKVDVQGHPNFGTVPPQYTNEIVFMCPGDRNYYFPMEEDFNIFKQDPQNEFDPNAFTYINNSASFPNDDFYKTQAKVGTQGNNVKKIEDGGIVKYWYHPSPVPLDGAEARKFLGVSNTTHL
jgi:hypothetical protein